MQDQSPVVNDTLFWAFGSSAITLEKANESSHGNDISPWIQVPVPKPVDAPIAVRMSNYPVNIKLTFNLEHNHIYFLNVRSQNRLGLWGAEASKGVLIDLIPPFPSNPLDPDRCSANWTEFYSRPDVVENLIFQGLYGHKVIGCENYGDRMLAQHCNITRIIDWMGTQLSSRCKGTANYLPNHRELRDSNTVFNGDNRGAHKLYQGERTFISLNWLGFFVIACLP